MVMSNGLSLKRKANCISENQLATKYKDLKNALNTRLRTYHAFNIPHKLLMSLIYDNMTLARIIKEGLAACFQKLSSARVMEHCEYSHRIMFPSIWLEFYFIQKCTSKDICANIPKDESNAWKAITTILYWEVYSSIQCKNNGSPLYKPGLWFRDWIILDSRPKEIHR